MWNSGVEIPKDETEQEQDSDEERLRDGEEEERDVGEMLIFLRPSICYLNYLLFLFIIY